MARISYLKRIGAVYYARIDVPLDLVKIVGSTTLKKSLRTKDEDEAKRRVNSVIDAWRRHFDELRLRRAGTDDDMKLATWQHYEAELERDDFARSLRPTKTDIEVAAKSLIAKMDRGEIDGSNPLAAIDVISMKSVAAYDASRRKFQLMILRKHLAEGETALIAHEADEFIALNKLLILPGSAEYRDLCHRLTRASIEALERTLERDVGDYSGTPKDPLIKPATGKATATAAPGEGIMDLFALYEKENARGIKQDTLRQARRDVRTFADLVGNIPVSGIDAAAVSRWKALLMEAPVKWQEMTAFRGMSLPQVVEANKTIQKPKIGNRTVNRYLGGLGAFCKYLVTRTLISRNPVTGFQQNEDDSDKGQSFTAEQLNILFASPLFHGAQSDDKWHLPGNHQIRDHRYWMPLIMLYSGARPAEVGQLLVGDVRMEHGQWIIHVTVEGGHGKSVKTKGSMRIIPVHPELIRLGFAEYHASKLASGDPLLFPHAVRNSRGQMSADYSKKFGKFLTHLGIKDGRGVSLYSLRHGFMDAMRRAEYLDEQFGFLVGHAKATVTGRYGNIPQGMLRQRVEMVNAVSYPGLDISQLYPVKTGS